jgi:hypothetical protein
VSQDRGPVGPQYVVMRLLAEWLQLWLLVVTPTVFSLPQDALWWRVVSFVSLDKFMAGRVGQVVDQANIDILCCARELAA